jgi:hypothetical protein
MFASDRADLECANMTQTRVRLVNATIQQTTGPSLRIGDRVRVTSTGIELL